MKTVSHVIISSAMTCLLSISGFTFTPHSRAETFPPVIGVEGTPGDDFITQTSSVEAATDETTDQSEELGVSATGIDALGGDDTVTTSGAGSVTADADAAADVDLALSRVGTEASATGILAGPDADSVTAGASITVTSDAITDTGEASFLILEPGLTNAGSSATANATGVAGGSGTDSLTNNDELSVTATADNSLVKGTLTAIELPVDVLGLGEAQTTAGATAIGITGGTTAPASSCDYLFQTCWNKAKSGTETITNNGGLIVGASATASSGEVTIELLGRERGDASTAAGANAIGISGSAWNNIITNNGTMDVDAIASSHTGSADIRFSVIPLPTPPDLLLEAFGADIGESNTLAVAKATGISGEGGNDTIDNNGPGVTGGEREPDVYAEATADSSSLRLELGIPTSSSATAASVAATTDATATDSTGTLPDQSSEEDLGYADMATTAHAFATGIAGGGGNDTINNNTPFKTETYADANSFSMSVGLAVASGKLPIGFNFSVADGETAAEALSIGIDGGSGDDTIDNTDYLNVIATAEATSESFVMDFQAGDKGIAFSVGLADGSAKGTAISAGITGASGTDNISNSGHIISEATSDITTKSIVVGLSGVAEGFAGAGSLALAESASYAYSYGIDGGTHENSQGALGDNIENEGVVDSIATSTALAKSVSLTAAYAGTGVVAGISLADADSTAEAHATGIRTDAGEDTITSQGDMGAVNAEATANADSLSVAVTLTGTPEGVSLGASAAQAATEAIATTAGIESGAGDDTINNSAALTSNATADSDSLSVAVTAGIAPFSLGAALAQAETRSDATATGIGSGEGNDDVTNQDLIDVDATATARAESVSVNISIAGAALSDVSSTAVTHATGMDGGAGVDWLINEGDIQVDANSTIDALSASAQLLGFAEGNVSGTSEATAIGIDGGDRDEGDTGGNTIINSTGASVTVLAQAKSDAENYVVQAAGVIFAETGSTSATNALGLAGGFGNDTVNNQGIVDVTAWSEVDATSFSFQLGGAQEAKTGINAAATAIGIDASEGKNEITNAESGSINVHANTDTLAAAVSADIVGVKVTSAGTTATGFASGIQAGSGQDIIHNEGDVDVTAKIYADAGSGAIGLFALSSADSLTNATLEGINGGDGDDLITNSGSLTVGDICSGSPTCDLAPNNGPIARSRAASVSFNLISIVSTRLKSSARLSGIVGGGGDDTIFNSGTLTVGDGEDWMVFGETDSFAADIVGFQLAIAYSNAELNTYGMEGGAGDDEITNQGTMTVAARSYADAYAYSDILALIGLGIAESNVDAIASARGIQGGQGNDVLTNSGLMSIEAHAKGRAESEGDVGDLVDVYTGSNAEATTTAIGMDAGSGANVVTNTGSINASAFSETASITDARTGSSGEAYSKNNSADLSADAWGILGGENDDDLFNLGNISVTAQTGEQHSWAVHAYAEEHVEVGPGLPANTDGVPNVTDPGVEMYATATGIEGGGGQDFISNSQTIEANAYSHAWGWAENDSNERWTTADISLLSQATATGLKATDGDSTFINTGLLAINAEATGRSHALSDSWYGAAADAWIKADAVARGIFSDQGYATISNSGTANISAYGTTFADTRADSGGDDYDHARSSAIGMADAIGFAVGDSGSWITNSGTMTVNAIVGLPDYADLSARSHGDENGTSVANADASAVGIKAGSGYNEIINQGTLTVNATAQNSVWARGFHDTGTASATSNAGAVGISAGVVEGNETGNLIMNSGGITVIAVADAVAVVSDDSDHNGGEFETETASAIGIETGGGNDIVYNSGTIVTREAMSPSWLLGLPGTGISTGTGNDEIYLFGDSLVDGDILLADGDDLLSFQDNAQVVRWVSHPGFVDGGNGTDTLRIEDRNSFTIAPPTSMENLEVDQGQLVIEGDYALPADGLLRVEIYNPDVGDLGYGQLVVNGNATLDGALSVIALPRLYLDGQTFDVMTADSIATASDFTLVDLPDPTPLLNFSLVDPRPLEQIVRIETSVEPFSFAARYPLYRTIADYLDRVTPSATGDLASLLGAFQLTPESGIDAAFASLSPDTHDNYTVASYYGVSLYHEALNRRMWARRVGDLFSGASGQQGRSGTARSPLLLAYNDAGNDAGSFHADEKITVPAWWRDVWVTPFGQWGDQDGEDGYTGFDYNVLGITVGIDRPVSDRLVLGVSAAYTDTDVDQEKGRGDGDIEGWMASLYGSYSLDNAYVDGALSYGRNDYDAKRKVRVGTINRTARSDHDGDVLAATLGGGYLIARDDSVLEPFGRLRYVRLDEDAFTESGAGSVNQQISSRDTDSLTSEIGMRVSRLYQKATGWLTTDASIAWLHDFDIDDRTITTSYTGAPASSFSIPGQDVERNGVTLGLGVGFETRKGVSTSLNYNGEFRDGFSAHGVIGRISYRF